MRGIEILDRVRSTQTPLTDAEANWTREQIELLDQGKIAVCEPGTDGEWHVNHDAKAAILLYFKCQKLEQSVAGPFHYSDLIPLKKNYHELNVRAVPPATARYGSFMEPKVVLMPSYVNIGAYIGSGTMVDTWATVGSCARIGKRVHLSGGVGIGGVLEPVSATPVIIEDDCFIGSRCIVVEGVKVGRGSILAAGVSLTASTPIIDVRTSESKVLYGEVPPHSVVLPGTRPKKIAGVGEIQLGCAYIVADRSEVDSGKTDINSILREFSP